LHCTITDNEGIPMTIPPANVTIVQKLGAPARGAMLTHLQRLSHEDRRLRFGVYMTDPALAHYVADIDFAHDHVFGILGSDLTLLGMAHLALDRDKSFAELGLSVDPVYRGRGYGLALLERGRLAAVNRGYRTLFMHCLTENKVMVRLARKAGLRLITQEGEVDALLALENTNLGAMAAEAMADQIALADYFLKRQFQWAFRSARARDTTGAAGAR